MNDLPTSNVNYIVLRRLALSACAGVFALGALSGCDIINAGTELMSEARNFAEHAEAANDPDHPITREVNAVCQVWTQCQREASEAQAEVQRAAAAEAGTEVPASVSQAPELKAICDAGFAFVGYALGVGENCGEALRVLAECAKERPCAELLSEEGVTNQCESLEEEFRSACAADGQRFQNAAQRFGESLERLAPPTTETN